MKILNVTGRCCTKLSLFILYYKGNIVIKVETFYTSVKDFTLIYDKLNILVSLWILTLIVRPERPIWFLFLYPLFLKYIA